MAADFDLAPLTWVQGEIRQALAQADQALQACAEGETGAADTAPLKFAQTYVHQAHGALSIVGLEGLTQVTAAVEQVMAAIDRGELKAPAQAGAVCRRAIAAVVQYLDDLLAGAPDQALKLLPAYRELLALIGVEEISPAELFFPDLTRALPQRESAVAAPNASPGQLRQARFRFQRGLLKWLKDDVSGLGDMRGAVAAVENSQGASNARAFWWISLALLDALAAGGLRVDNSVKRLCARIDTQMRKLREGSRKVPERLLRELLYRVAVATRGSGLLQRVRETYALERQLPPIASTSTAVQRKMRDAVLAAQQHWDDYVSSDESALAAFRLQIETLQAGAEELGQADLLCLSSALILVGDPAGSGSGRPGTGLALEVATALLLAENALENHDHLGQEFSQQAEVMTRRLKAMLQGLEPAAPELPKLGEFSRQAQERLLLRQVGREMLANLGRIEQTLDAFFRDPGRHDELHALAQPLRQIEGALTLLGEPAAADLLQLCATQVASFASGQSAPRQDDCESLAQHLSALGLFIETMQHGRADLDAILGRAPTANLEAHAGAATMEAPLASPPAAAREAGIEAEAQSKELDQDLLGIFVEEAHEVLASVSGELQRSLAAPHDQQALTVIRRAFHTLKGSGRMVGLVDLADVAFAVEKVLNLWLKAVAPATPALHEMLHQARAMIGAWVSAIESGDVFSGDTGALLARCADLQGDGAIPDHGLAGEHSPGTHSNLSAAIHDMYLAEARGHLAVLQGGLAALTQSPPSEAMIRAAHTLAGVSATVGVLATNSLALALERALQRAASRGLCAEAASQALLAQAIESLSRINAAVLAGQAPEDGAALIVALDAWPPAAPTEPAGDDRPAPEQQRRKLRLADDLDSQLLPIFLEESEDLLRQIGLKLRQWQAAPGDASLPLQMQRLLHTLKGSARMAGAMAMGELLHGLETRVIQLARSDPSAVMAFDQIEAAIDRAQALREALLQREAAAAPPPSAAGNGAAELALEPPRASAGAPSAQLRVRADLIDSLVNEAGEVAVARGRIEGEIRLLKASLLDLTDSVIKLRGQLREVEIQADTQMQSKVAQAQEGRAGFDPLEMDRYTRFQELTRMMAESVNDVATVQQTLLKNVDHANAALTAQARLNRQLSQSLMAVRMVPFDTLADRLHRIVRQTAKELGRRANLDIRGGQSEIDRSVLDQVVGPIEHLLRNALIHGIEDCDQRVAAGKSEIGEISISLQPEGNDIAIELSDDGRGLDQQRIVAKAVELGLLAADAPLVEGQLTQLIFLPGFSTAAELSDLAGRGVGLDVVKSEIGKLGGRIEVASQSGQGTRFRISLPLSLSISQAVLIGAGSRRYALAASLVEQVLELKPDAAQQLRQRGYAEWQAEQYAWHYLPRLLGGVLGQPQAGRRHWFLLLKSAQARIALEVEELLGRREVVVKSVGPQLSRLVGISGATVLGDGEVALIINPIALAARPPLPAEAARTPTEVATSNALVMVVDDSLTVRKVTGRLLEREGYQVVTAKDGLDALNQMQDFLPGVVLTDIEMPHMDGFELARRVRGDPRLKAVPIIVITSRSAEKHRSFARELGIDHYMGKPYAEDELLRLIRRLLKAQQAVAGAALAA